MKELKDEVKEFRKKLNRKYGLDKLADDVYYVGLYVFPVTQGLKNNDEQKFN